MTEIDRQHRRVKKLAARMPDFFAETCDTCGATTLTQRTGSRTTCSGCR
jgi:hypothetical protein